MADSSFGATAMRSNGPYGPSISMIENNAGNMGVGNYKGVMLCNRPFGGSTAVTGKVGTTSEKTTFTCGVVPESIGLNVPIAMKDKYTKRPNKDSVLAKHKKWLSDLQKTKNQLEAQYINEMQRKEEEKVKFQEHEKRMREIARTLLSASNTESELNTAKDDKSSSDAKPESKGYEPHEMKGTASNAAAQPKAVGGVSFTADAKKSSLAQNKKPAWAMSEKESQDAEEELEFQEAEDLLDFAKGLDYDKYIGDMEVKTMMERLRKRITEYEKEILLDESREMDAEQRAAKREMLELMGQTENNLKNDQWNKNNQDNEAMYAAKALLQDEDDLQAVHSTKSVTALLKQAKDKISSVRDSVQKPAPPAEAKVWNEPVIVTHNAEDAARLELKNAVSNLPYMHRNPAV